jgi:secreted trypsin-like serine protease
MNTPQFSSTRRARAGLSVFLIALIGSLVALPFAASAPVRAAGTIYVTPNGTGDGSSWGSATNLQDALAVAQYGNEIWMAAGVYYPDKYLDPVPADPREATFSLATGVPIYGGFAASGEPEWGDRDAEPTPTPIAEPAIVGGTPATLGEFPWQVALLFDDYSGSYEQGCGGSLIADAWVLTAAHCVVEEAGTIDPATIRVAAGSIDLTTITTDQHIAVDQIIPHPSYDYDNPYTPHDIALLHLAEPADTSNPNIATIDLLPLADEATLAAPGIDATVTGWGRITEGGDYSDVLLKVDVPIVSNQACRQAYAAAGYKGTIYDSELCAGGEAGRDTCEGDSGGPLVVPAGSGFMQAGIVSWGGTAELSCGQEGIPGVYTRVTSYQDWIAAVLDSPAPPTLEIDHSTGSPGSSFVLTVTNTLSTTASLTITVNDSPLDVITVAAESSLPVVLETQAEMRAGTYRVRAQVSVSGADAQFALPSITLVLSDDTPQRTASAAGAPVLTLPLTVDPLEPRELTMSHDSGQPGSTFVITGTFFPYATTFVEVTINDNLVETVPISPGGEFTLVLQTAADAYEGKYDVSIDVYAEDRFLEGEEDFFFLEADAPLHTDSVSGAPVIQVPADISPELSLTISRNSGQPGSTFIITGTHFPADTLLDVKVSNLFTSETIPTDISVISSDADGSFTFVLATTPQAEPGVYVLTLFEAGSDASVPSPLASVVFSLAADAPLLSNSLPDVPVITLQEAATSSSQVYLPLIVR